MNKTTPRIVGVLAALAFLLAFAASAFAQGFFVSPKVGTQGFGLDLGYEIIPEVKTRFNINGATYSDEDTVDDVKYDADLTLLTAGMLLDWHPFRNGFRISGGLYYNGNSLDGDAKLSDTQTYDIGDTTYTGSQLGTLEAEAEFNPIAPYFGFGWGTNPDPESHWHFSLDLGVMYQGDPSVDMETDNPLGIPGLEDEVEKEEKNAEEEVEGYAWYPVIAIGFTYRF